MPDIQISGDTLAASACIYLKAMAESAIIHIENAKSAVMFSLYQSNGVLLMMKTNLGNGDFELNRNTLPPGRYRYKISDEGETLSKGEIIIS